MKESSFEKVQNLAQNFVNRVPVVILGSGASAAYDIPGMVQLGEHLMSSVTPNESDRGVWNDFIITLPKIGLENALNEVTLPDELTNTLVKATREFLLPYETRLLEAVMSGEKKLSLTRLYKHLFCTVHKEIHIITSNYDRLAEYSADVGQFACTMGFSHGYIRHKMPAIKICKGNNQLRTVCVWKVHGSMDWFATATNQFLAIPSVGQCPSCLKPTMITPGISKYRKTHDEPFRTIMAFADDALSNANSYLCIGYGFNDDHIQTKLIEKCNITSPIVVLAKTLSPAARKILFEGSIKKFLALEKCDEGTKAYFKEKPEGTIIPSMNLWNLDEFLDMIFGGAK